MGRITGPVFENVYHWNRDGLEATDQVAKAGPGEGHLVSKGQEDSNVSAANPEVVFGTAMEAGGTVVSQTSSKLYNPSFYYKKACT
jgi:hypothetical protein